MIRKFKLYFTILAALFLFSGCALSSSNNNVDFNDISKEITKDLKTSSILYITDFVNIASLENTSQLGFILASNTKVAILNNDTNTDTNDKKAKKTIIKELTIGKNIKIGKQGIKLLSRELSKLKTTKILANSQVLVGTYAITSKQLIVYLKLINLDTDELLFSKTTSVPITDEILELEGIDTTSQDIYIPLVL